MALGLSITGILAIVVVVLALIIVLLGMTGRVKRLDSQLKASEEDNITPYLRTVVHYRKSDFTDESKLNALNKISKQFFRDTFRFSSEKTFDDIASLSQDSDIKSFCSLMGIIRYSKTVKKSDVDSLYRSFENILVRRRPASAVVLNDNSSSNRKPMTIDELNNRKVRKDILDIKDELGKMKTQGSLTSQTPHQQVGSPSPPKTNNFFQPSNQNSLVKFSVDEKLSEMEEEIDKEAVHEVQSSVSEPAVINNQDSSINPQPEPRVINVLSQGHNIPTVNPNRVISSLVRGSSIRILKPQKTVISKPTVNSVSPYQARAFKHNNKKLSFDKVRLDNDDESLSQEINNLNLRIQKLLDAETGRQLSSIEQGRY